MNKLFVCAVSLVGPVFKAVQCVLLPAVALHRRAGRSLSLWDTFANFTRNIASCDFRLAGLRRLVLALHPCNAVSWLAWDTFSNLSIPGFPSGSSTQPSVFAKIFGMVASITCICGYRGPGVPENGGVVCPICRTPVAAREETLHIPCPRGHVLKVTAGMLGQRVVCPKCNEFFVLAAEASVERRREMERQGHEQDARRARLWLARALWAATIVLVLLVTLVVISVMGT